MKRVRVHYEIIFSLQKTVKMRYSQNLIIIINAVLVIHSFKVLLSLFNNETQGFMMSKTYLIYIILSVIISN